MDPGWTRREWLTGIGASLTGAACGGAPGDRDAAPATATPGGLLAMIMAVSTAPTRGGQGAPGYDVRRTGSAGAELLDAPLAAWRAASVVDWGDEPHTTRFRALWDADALFLRFDVVDESPWSTMMSRDDPIWDEEVVEIFLDLDGSGENYAELEISPANVVCDVRMVRGMPDKEMDLGWDLEGLETRVSHGVVDGGRGWVAMARIPWRSFATLPSAAAVALPPRLGDVWRFDLFRITRPHGPGDPARDAIFSAWSPTGQASFHVPSAFRPFRLVDQ